MRLQHRLFAVLTSSALLAAACSAPLGEGASSDYRPSPPPESRGPAPASDFGFVFFDGSCYDEVLDTFDGTYTTLVQRPPSAPITVPMQLPDERLEGVFDLMIEVSFFRYPDVFAVPTPMDGRMLLQTPAAEYRITVRNGAEEKSVEWVDDIISPVDQPAVELRRLIRVLQRMIQEHPAYRLIPPRQYACG